MNIKNNYLSIDHAYLIDSGNSWATVCIFAWVHGNEPSGIHATKQILEELWQGELSLKNWRLILVTCANQEAEKISKRFVDQDMNRLFGQEKNDSYEAKRTKELEILIEESDFFLDLHSTSNPSSPFLFTEQDSLTYAKQLWARHIVTWRANIWPNWDSESYARKKQNCIAFTYESWCHQDIEWTQNAYDICLQLLVWTQLLPDIYDKKKESCTSVNILWYHTCQTDSFKYHIPVHNFMKFDTDTIIASDGDKILSIQKWHTLVMPKKIDTIIKGKEAFFWGTEG